MYHSLGWQPNPELLFWHAQLCSPIQFHPILWLWLLLLCDVNDGANTGGFVPADQAKQIEQSAGGRVQRAEQHAEFAFFAAIWDATNEKCGELGKFKYIKNKI